MSSQPTVGPHDREPAGQGTGATAAGRRGAGGPPPADAGRLLDHLPIAVVVGDRRLTMTWGNRIARARFTRPAGDDHTAIDWLADLVDDGADRVRSALADALEAGTDATIEVRVSGGRAWSVGITRVDEDRWLATVADTASPSSAADRRYAARPTMGLTLDLDGVVVHANSYWRDVLGYELDELVGVQVGDLFTNIDVNRWQALRDLLALQGTERTIELTATATGGTAHHLSASARLDDADVIVLVGRDVTDAANERRRLVELATHDALTGLLNRQRLLDLGTSLLANRPCAVIYFDLDGFKPVNDRYGHATGDQLLEIIASRLTNIGRGVDVLARVGGDEFVVIAPLVTDLDDAVALGERIVEACRAPVHLPTVVVEVGVSVGAIVAPAGTALEDALRAADEALYEAKRHGGGVRAGSLGSDRGDGGPTRVLVVEDESDAAVMISMTLRVLGDFDVRTAATAEEARTAFAEHEPRIAVVDLLLPDGDGLALAESFLERRPQTRVILTSAHLTPALVDHAETLGFDAVVAKTTLVDELGAILAS